MRLVRDRHIHYRSKLNDADIIQSIDRFDKFIDCFDMRPTSDSPCAVASESQSKDMASQRSKLQEDSYFRILHYLQDNPEMSQRKLAEVVGVSVGGINYVLNALIDKGLIKLGTFNASEDKRRYAYVLTPKGIARRAALTKAFLARKMQEYEALKAEIEALSGELGIEDPADAARKS